MEQKLLAKILKAIDVDGSSNPVRLAARFEVTVDEIEDIMSRCIDQRDREKRLKRMRKSIETERKFAELLGNRSFA